MQKNNGKIHNNEDENTNIYLSYLKELERIALLVCTNLLGLLTRKKGMQQSTPSD